MFLYLHTHRLIRHSIKDDYSYLLFIFAQHFPWAAFPESRTVMHQLTSIVMFEFYLNLYHITIGDLNLPSFGLVTRLKSGVILVVRQYARLIRCELQAATHG